MESVTLEQVIRSHIPLPAYPSAKGWYHVLCKVCMDHGKKGNRGGFKFENDTVAYNCFNCGHTAAYNPNEDTEISKNMKTVLRDFGIPDEEWQQVLLTSLSIKDTGATKTIQELKKRSIEPPEIPMPESFYFLKDASEDDKWAAIARDYLLYDRGIDPSSYPFMLSSKPKDPHMEKWRGRVIIPFYKNNHLIYYQGRDLVGNKVKKYESPPISKDRVIYGFDELFKNTDIPLYIVEGWFDARVIDGVAIIGNKISDAQIDWLNKSRRRKVYIPDRFGDGHQAAKQALDEGWSISTPEIGSCKDMSAAVQKYGKMYVMKSIVDNTADGFAALTQLGIYCDQSKRTKKNKKSPEEKRRHL